MAITNAQQYQQLVNKPANGKRPGYRGDAAYGDKDEKGQVKDSFAAGDGFDKESFQRARDKGEAKRTLEILKEDKEEEKVERFRNKQFKFVGIDNSTTGGALTPFGTPTVTVTNNSITAIKSAALTANTTTELLTQPLVVEGGNTLTVQSSTSNSFDVAISYLNIKKEITT